MICEENNRTWRQDISQEVVAFVISGQNMKRNVPQPQTPSVRVTLVSCVRMTRAHSVWKICVMLARRR